MGVLRTVGEKYHKEGRRRLYIQLDPDYVGTHSPLGRLEQLRAESRSQ
jgi:hypothetical protein